MAEEWGTWDPAAGRAWWYAAEAAQELDDMEGLARCLALVPPTDPNALFAQVEKANLEWTTLNKALVALETSEQVLAKDPRVVEVQSRVISFYAMTLQRAPMLRAIRAAIDAGAEPKESYPYLMMADVLTFSNAGKLNSVWMKGAPNELRLKIAFAVHTAMSYALSADAGSSEEAIEMNAEAMRQLGIFLEGAPHDPVLLTYLMLRAYQAGDVERVGRLLQNVDDSTADDHMIWVFRSWYHFAVDEFDAAEEAIKEALKLHPLSHMAHHEYAKILRKLRRPETEVALHQKLATEGKELRMTLLQRSSVLDAPADLLKQIATYASECGDEQVAAALTRRLEPFP